MCTVQLKSLIVSFCPCSSATGQAGVSIFGKVFRSSQLRLPHGLLVQELHVSLCNSVSVHPNQPCCSCCWIWHFCNITRLSAPAAISPPASGIATGASREGLRHSVHVQRTTIVRER
jgi:hypothetical protein